jgi:hypothetical protein
MAQIYKNAFVTISAAKAKGCHEGFLKTEGRATTHDLRKQSFKLDVATPKDPEIVKKWIKAERYGRFPFRINTLDISHMGLRFLIYQIIATARPPP